MKCSCMDSSASYERLPNVPTYFELTSMFGRDSEDKDRSTEKQEELVFYNDDNSYQTVIVEKNLCVSDLCQLLALKNRVAKDVNWTIIEHWTDLGLERSLEDHEDVLSTYHNMESFAKRTAKRFVFRKNFIKYEFFPNPQQFFPVNMIDMGDADDLPASVTKPAILHSILSSRDECPTVFSHVWIREANKQVWTKSFLLLKDKKLFLSYKDMYRVTATESCNQSQDTHGGDCFPTGRWLSDFHNLRVVLLRDFPVNGAGPPLALFRLSPNIEELDLSKTLLRNWVAIAEIVHQLEGLKILNLSDNRIEISGKVESKSFSSLQHIILGKLLYNWYQVLKCSEFFLNIEVLQVQYNKIDVLEEPSPDIFSRLALLDLEGNPLKSWEEVNKLGSIGSLETLNVSNCGIKSVYFPAAGTSEPVTYLFKNLKNLILTGNEIDDWNSISEMDKLQSLYDLRFRDNPVLAKETLETNHQLIIARIKNLQVLNGQIILPEERKGAEIDYIKRFGMSWLKLNSENDIHSFNTIHPCYKRLIEKYGPPEENELRKPPTSLKSQLIQIEIFSPEKTFLKKVPYNMSVQKLSGLIQRLFNTGSTMPRLSCIHADREDGLEVPLDDYLKDLNFYSVENGDKISVRW